MMAGSGSARMQNKKLNTDFMVVMIYPDDLKKKEERGAFPFFIPKS